MDETPIWWLDGYIMSYEGYNSRFPIVLPIYPFCDGNGKNLFSMRFMVG